MSLTNGWSFRRSATSLLASLRRGLASAVLVAALTVAASAQASDCWKVTGWTNSGQVGGTAQLTSVSCQSTPSGYAWAHVELGYSSSPDGLYLLISLSDSHVSGMTFQPLLMFSHRDASNVPVVYLDLILCTGCSNQIPLTTTPPPCRLTAYWWDTSQKAAQEDGLGCRLAAVPAGGSPFIWSNGYYITPTITTQCPIGSYDGANCYVMGAPAGAFIQNNSLYVPAGAGNSCSSGTYDGIGCRITTAPSGTHAFLYGGNFYTTTRRTCLDGFYDGANCYIGSGPSGRTASIMNGYFYYSK